MFVAIEAFEDQDVVNGVHLDSQLRRFGEYVARLGVQPVTVTVSSLVEDMLDSYCQITTGLSAFSWDPDLVGLVEEFVLCQDVWHYSPNRQPTLEAKFSILNYGPELLDVEIAFTPCLPTVEFENLRNTITEGEVFTIQPRIASRAGRASCPIPTEVEYYLGPGAGWLSWDDSTAGFCGAMSAKMASDIGAERFDSYTVPLELTARLIRHFGNMRFERIFRCVLPLTVKRRATRCTFSSASSFSSPDQCRARPTLVRPPLMRSHVRPGKENDSLSIEEVHKLLERKAEAGKRASPLRLNSLSLARLHDAVALAHPPASLTDVEVRTVQYRRDSPHSNKENHQAPVIDLVKRPTTGIEPRTPRSEPTRHCDSKMSDRIVDEANEKPSTPPLVCYKCTALGREQSKRSKGVHGECTRCADADFFLNGMLDKNWLSQQLFSCLARKDTGDLDKKAAVDCQPGPSRRRVPQFHAPSTEDFMQFLQSMGQVGRKSDSTADTDATASRTAEAEPSDVDIDRWQASILRNYKEFEEKATSMSDCAIEDNANGDESEKRSDGEMEFEWEDE